MRKLLWIGDACCDSGFAKATHYTLDVLRHTWDVAVLGINHRGDPHPYPYPIFPAWPGEDMFGVGRLKEVTRLVQPDCIVIQNDPWNVPIYTRTLQKLDVHVPVIASLAVDGKNCRGDLLNDLTAAFFWTRFAVDEARVGGYMGPATVIPLGVDLDIYRPQDRITARKRFKMDPLDRFIVGNVNRNQPRKRLDLTIAYFAEWVKSYDVQDATLFLHVAPTGDRGIDCEQLGKYYGLKKDQMCLSIPGVWKGAKEEAMAALYATFDVQMSTTQGEGWGLTTLEGMACGIPQVVPDWSALGEWARDAAVLVPCYTTSVTPSGINAIGGVADKEATIEALNTLYRNINFREDVAYRGLALAQSAEYRWPNIGKAFNEALDLALAGLL